MAKFTLRIDCDNAAFESDPAMEVHLILHRLSRELTELAWTNKCKSHDSLRDTNGNRVGFWTYTP